MTNIAQVVTEVGDAPPRGPFEGKRLALQSKLNEYISSTFPAELSGCTVFEKDAHIFITISGEKPNLRSYWSGKWNSNWTVQMDTSLISGEIKVHAHYYEDGNFQLQTAKKISSEPIDSSSDESFASAIVALITVSNFLVYLSNINPIMMIGRRNLKWICSWDSRICIVR